MTERPAGSSQGDPAGAGVLLITCLVLGAAAGAGLGSLVGLALPAGVVGLFCGLAGGFALVYARFKNI